MTVAVIAGVIQPIAYMRIPASHYEVSMVVGVLTLLIGLLLPVLGKAGHYSWQVACSAIWVWPGHGYPGPPTVVSGAQELGNGAPLVFIDLMIPCRLITHHR